MEASQEIIQHVGSLSYLGLFGISLMANVVIPVPEELIIIAIGYAVGAGVFGFWQAFVVVLLGSLISDIAMFLLSRSRNKYVVLVYEKFFAKIVPMRQDFVEKHITKIVFISRFVVNLRFIGPFLAGRVRMSWKKFIVWDTFALIVYILVSFWAGHYFANRIESIFNGVETFKNITAIMIGMVIVWSVGQIIKKAFFSFEKKGEAK